MNSSPFFSENTRTREVHIDNTEGLNANQLRALFLRFTLSHRNGDFSEEDYEMLQRLDELEENESESESESGSESESILNNHDIESSNHIYNISSIRGRMGRHGISKELISTILIYRYTNNNNNGDIKDENNNNNESCSVCLNTFVENENLRILPCMHKYHCKCIDKWLYKQSATCPICKSPVCT